MSFQWDDDMFTMSDARRMSRFPNSRHSAPIVLSPQREVLDLWVNRTPPPNVPSIFVPLRRLNELAGESKHYTRVSIDPGPVYTYILRCVGLKGKGEGFNLLVDSLKISRDILASELNALSIHHAALRDLSNFSNKLHRPSLVSISHEVYGIYRMMTFLTRIRNTAQHLHTRMIETSDSPFECQQLKIFLAYPLFFVGLADCRETLFLVNYDQLLMLTDTVTSRFLTALACLLNEEIRTDDLPTWRVVKQIYTWGDDLLRVHGDKAYSVIGMFEDIVTNSFVNFPGSDPLELGVPFTETLLVDAKKIRAELSIPLSAVETLIVILSNIGSVNWLSEVFGLRKHWGNPVVCPNASGEAVLEIVTEDLPVSGLGLVNLRSSFNRMIILEYISQNGRWPAGEFLVSKHLKSYPLQRAFKDNIVRMPEAAPGHHHFHWALFRFFPNCVIETFLNPLKIISDKSISYYRPNLDLIYVAQLRTIKTSTTMAEEQRRLLLEFLRTDHMAVTDIFKTVMSGNIPEAWLANSACMKGTEMKYMKARIFAVLTYELRQYFAATEELIKEHIFPYNPHQTMTMSEPKLLERLREVTKQMDIACNSEYLSVMHIVDFSKWNLRMKFSNTAGVFRGMDEFLGTPTLMTMSHILFSGMKNIIQDTFHPPENGVEDTESSTVWSFHNRGWEGQRQKGWTMLTSALLSDLERRTGVSSLICGQGDNQTLLSKFRIPSVYRNADEWVSRDPMGVRKVLDEFYALLEQECLSVGLKVKTGESCRSLCYFNYGKRLFFKGIELSMVLKRISKVTSEGNSTFPTTENLLKTLMGASSASGLFSHPSVIPILVGKIATFLQLHESYTVNPILGDVSEKIYQDTGCLPSSMLLARLMKIPSCLGGPSAPSTLDFFYRGHPDPYAADFALLTLKARAGCTASQALLTASVTPNSWLYEGLRQDRRALIESPFSLNLKIPLSASRPISDLIAPALSNYCKNGIVAPMFSSTLDAEEKKLICLLSETLPFCPLVVNDIFSRSVPGRKLSFMRGLSCAASLSRIAVDSMASPVILKVKELEYEQLLHWVQLADRVYSAQRVEPFDHKTPHHGFLQMAREVSWGCPIEGVTVPHPAEQFTLKETNYDLCFSTCKSCEREHVVFVRVVEDLYGPAGLPADNHPHLLRCRGADPYVGNTISEGVVQKQLLCLNPDSNIQDAIRLNTVRKWVALPGESLDHMLNALLQTRTDTPQDLLDATTGQPSRLSYNHRAALTCTVKTCSTSSTTNFASRFYISSNRMGEFSHGDVNFHLPYGPCFLFFTFSLGLNEMLKEGLRSSDSRGIYHAHLSSREVPTVYDGSITLCSPYDNLLGLAKTPDVLFSRYDRLFFHSLSCDGAQDFWRSPYETPIQESRRNYAYQLIADAAVKEVVRHETWVCLHRREYMGKGHPVSAGDVSLVGVSNFLRSIAESLLLLMPNYVFESPIGSGISQAIDDCVGALSASFWSQFATPFLLPRLNQQLISLGEGRIPKNVAQNTGGVSVLLRSVVSSQIYKLVVSHTRSSILKRHSPISLRAPNSHVAKVLLSRYVEMSILLLPIDRRLKKLRSDIARKAGAYIQSPEKKQIPEALLNAASVFDQACSQLEIKESVILPRVFIYNTTQSWIDRVRSHPSPPIDLINHLPVGLSHNLFLSLLREDISVGDSNRMVPSLPCRCSLDWTEYGIRSETLFLNSGILGKAHYRFLEIIVLMKLNPLAVMCLGTRTGAEAAALSMLESCHHIYVNCHLRLPDFAHHAAASYIPASFLIKGLSEKLISPSSAVLCENDLTREETIKIVEEHTGSIRWSGLTCDCDKFKEGGIVGQRNLILNICKLSSAVCRTKDFWQIVKIFCSCEHEVQELASIALCYFSNITLIRSSFTRARSKAFFLVCVNARMTSFPSGQILSGGLLETVHGSAFGRKLIMKASKEIYSRSVLSNRDFRVLSESIARLSSPSFMHACWCYLPGWATSETSCVTRVSAIASLRSYILSCVETASKVVEVHSKARKGVSMVRGSVLILTGSVLGPKLQTVGYRLFKARLLYLSLKDEVLDVAKLEETVRACLAEPFQLRVKGLCFPVDLNASRFLHLTSRYLCEILGTIYGADVHVGSMERKMPFHRTKHSKISQIHTSFWTLCPKTDALSAPNLSWMWKDRAVVISVLMFVQLGKRITFDNHRCYIPNPFLLLSLRAYLGADIPSDCFDINTQVLSSSFIWVSTQNDIQKVFQLTHPQYLCLVVDSEMYPKLFTSFEVLEVHRIPWLGVVPSRVLVLVRLKESTEGTACMWYPNLGEMADWVNDTGMELCGCSCSDCNAEVEILQHYTLTHRQLDLVCGWKTISTVMDRHN